MNPADLTDEELEDRLVLSQNNVRQATAYAAMIAKEMRRRREPGGH